MKNLKLPLPRVVEQTQPSTLAFIFPPSVPMSALKEKGSRKKGNTTILTPCSYKRENSNRVLKSESKENQKIKNRKRKIRYKRYKEEDSSVIFKTENSPYAQ